MSGELLPVALQAAVPLWIERVRHMTPGQRQARAAELADVITERGDVILYRRARRGESAAAFNALAEALAIGAFQPGGVTVFGSHWCTDHEACVAARHAPRLAALNSIAVLVASAPAVSFAESYRGLYLRAAEHGLSGPWAAAPGARAQQARGSGHHPRPARRRHRWPGRGHPVARDRPGQRRVTAPAAIGRPGGRASRDQPARLDSGLSARFRTASPGRAAAAPGNPPVPRRRNLQ